MYKRKIIIIFATCLLFFLPLLLFGGITGKISGVVTDRETGTPLPGANVVITGTQLGAAADLNAGMLTDVTELTLDGGQLHAVRPVLGGKVLRVEVAAGDGTQFAALMIGTFPMLIFMRFSIKRSGKGLLLAH